jgi:hypothetical protein
MGEDEASRLGRCAWLFRLGEARVCKEGVEVLVEQDVLRLEVTMKDGALAACNRSVQVQ